MQDVRDLLRRMASWSAAQGPKADPLELALGFLGGLIAILAVSQLSQWAGLGTKGGGLIGSFGATAVLLFATPGAPLSQPRNVVLGHAVSALVGVTIARFMPGDSSWLAAVAVAGAIATMQATRSVHPPGGATALIAVIGPAELKTLGYGYVISPVLSGAVIMVSVAMVFHAVAPGRSYPVSRA